MLKFIENAAKTPNVHFVVVTFLGEDLGGDVVYCTDERHCSWSIGDDAGDAKIPDFKCIHILTGDEYIFRLDVSMNDANAFEFT